MAVTRPGTTTTLYVNTWEGDEWPVEGDFLRTDAGSCYRIDKVKPARFGSAHLFSLVVTRLEKDAVHAGAPGVFRWQFAQR
jgi:hypothetical protein